MGKPSEVLIEALRRPVEEEGYGDMAFTLGPGRVQQTLVAGGCNLTSSYPLCSTFQAVVRPDAVSAID